MDIGTSSTNEERGIDTVTIIPSLSICTYRKIVSSLEHSSQMQQSSKEAAEDNTSSQPQLSTPATVECDDAAECRIINLELLSKHIEDVTQHVATCSTCQQSTNAITVVGEKHRNGLASIIGCKFNGCGQELTFATSTKNSGLTGKLYWTNNLAAVWGQMTVGGGFNSLQESMSVLGVPVMTKQSFIDTERVIGKWWWTALEESMLAAGKEEKQLAIKNGQYHQGIPAITVIIDGGWCKRTHKHSYNALSGVGVIFGKETKKLLYIGVRNKFCSVCAKESSKEHECFRNWGGPSSSMESDIILEGFCKAEKQHGLRYTNFIGDGDSSVHTTLISGVPGWGHIITKQECANHAVKCYRSALENLVKDKPHYKGRHKLTEAKRKHLTSSVRCAIIMRSKDADTKKVDKKKAAKLLQEDILNSVLHCFGDHHKCKADYCKTVRAAQPSIPSPTKDAIVSSNIASSTDKHFLDVSDASSPTQDISSSFLSDSFPDISGNSFSDSTADTSSSSLSSSILDSPNDTICTRDALVSSTLSTSTPDEIEEDVNAMLLEQQKSWEDATVDTQIELTDSLDPPMPLDHQMICDIQKLASRLAAKSHQLLGMYISHNIA